MRLICRNSILFYFSGSQISKVQTTANASFIIGQKPLFLQARMKQFTMIKQRMETVLASAQKPAITITLKDGKQIQGQAFFTTPLSLAKTLSRQLAQSAIVARVKYTQKYSSPLGQGPVSAQPEQISSKNSEYQLIDLTRPLQGNCSLELLTFEDKAGCDIFWHSSAHLLGQSLQNHFGAWLCHGPSLEEGFFYDSFMGDYRVSQTDYQKVQKQIKRYAQQKQQFERILLSKSEALEMFSYNPFKLQLIKNKVPEGGITSAYRCGNLVDLCTGPHLPSAQKVKGFKITKNSSAYWLGKKQNQNLQRVYGISFPKANQLQSYISQQEQLAKRDHRHIGSRQQLFNFSPLSPGSALFLPHGTIIYNRLIELMRSQYRLRGYKQVISPNLYNSQLWKMSGHYFKYKQNIFFVNQNGEENGLKPMNCPGHCLMFDLLQHSYRDLPIRMADFGVLHRNQLTGALTGLTRVRRFQQDDAHIFCRADQIQAQILAVLDLLDYVYSVFGFKYVLQLSTRPQKYLGKIEDWDRAQEQLRTALKHFGKQFKLNQGDGAFYGPKIDVKLFDVFGREHQCGTVQLDFQLPARFNLQYRAKEDKQKNDNTKVEQNQSKQKIQLSAQQIQQRRKQKQDRKKAKNNQAMHQQHKQETHSHNCLDNKENQCDHSKSHSQKVETLEQMEARYAIQSSLKTGFARPVMIHRAIFGSLERFIAILCEHTGGKWDFWISPRQVKVISMGSDTLQFSGELLNTLLLKGYCVEIDNSEDTLAKKIRKAQMQGFNYIAVVGREEAKEGTVNLRKRDQSKEIGKLNVEKLLDLLSSLQPPKSKKRLELQNNSIKL